MYFHNSKEVEDQKISQDTNDNPVEVDKLTGKSDILASDKAKEYYPDDKLFHKGNQPIKTTFKIIFESFKAAINDKNVIKWSLWWSISMCGYLQVNKIFFLRKFYFEQCLIAVHIFQSFCFRL